MRELRREPKLVQISYFLPSEEASLNPEEKAGPPPLSKRDGYPGRASREVFLDSARAVMTS